eukprot:CAMPEP_0172913210 /NCGR_PEP_ID=MMETSP1075-20121228/189960_1 /TAXON_ID=2916 /ORGANISM="Ceratium fusus, Strain PA161109" /LENGTH=64 /DNA_ID=CAMNT_0013771883 /DNA_START=91 /DNA_END=283 /DNA_ORIENTATION=-
MRLKRQQAQILKAAHATQHQVFSISMLLSGSTSGVAVASLRLVLAPSWKTLPGRSTATSETGHT